MFYRTYGNGACDTMRRYHRTHFEGTWFDNRGLPGSQPNVGAGAFNSPYRWRPLEWKYVVLVLFETLPMHASIGHRCDPSNDGYRACRYNNDSYVNERTVGVQQTAWSFVAQMRSHLPDPIGGLFWFGVDDTAHSVHTPIYCASTSVPASFADR